ncbi:CapA family protein [Aurantiacibacter poecillastricola]|uniref:CapA family protein n=1 Tax=Aurantiacibacter poecillastricola TaxID=3064385 RepID=UPI00273F2342|nr:CapA family protein [Aurantiacibacter sp. 219JJ12-13]MDP5261304.1 CapA family protein [Aurantiacibacter sp. 219JJ12-13]
MQDATTVAVTGDLVLDEPDAGYWLSGIAPALKAADIAIGHLEVPHTKSEMELEGDVPAPGAPLENLRPLVQAGFDILSLAGNHIADRGAEGIAETVAELEKLGIAFCGAGANLEEARRPAFAHSKGHTVALLSYNCIGPEMAWAADDRAGCAYLPLETSDGAQVTPIADFTGAASACSDILQDDIEAARRGGADHVVVALHKGRVHTPAHVAPYEREVARLAVDAGADAVISHHAHIVQGIEFYRGAPIFHGLGNGCVVTRALSPDQDHAARREWALRRKELFGFEPDPDYYLAPFHPEAVSGFIGQLTFHHDAQVMASIVPVDVEAPGRPVLAEGNRAQDILRYVEDITARAGLPPIRISPHGLVRAAA